MGGKWAHSHKFMSHTKQLRRQEQQARLCLEHARRQMQHGHLADRPWWRQQWQQQQLECAPSAEVREEALSKYPLLLQQQQQQGETHQQQQQRLFVDFQQRVHQQEREQLEEALCQQRVAAPALQQV